MIYKLSQHVCFEMQDEVTGAEILTSPYLYIYDFIGNRTVYELFREDGSNESRKQGWSYLHDNVQLSPTPYFYYDSLVPTSGGYHPSKRIDRVLSSNLSGMIQYRNCKLRFVNGWAYDESGTMGVMLRVYTKNENNDRVNLLQFVDYGDDSLIKADTSILYQSNIYNSSIDLKILDIDYIFASSDDAMVELRTLLFNDIKPTVLFIEFSTFTLDDLSNFIFNNKTFTTITQEATNQQQATLSQADDEIICNLSYVDRRVGIRMEHTQYNLEGYIKNTYGSTSGNDGIDVTFNMYHDVSILQYDENDVEIKTEYYRLINIESVFDEIFYQPYAIPDTDHIEVLCTSTIVSSEGVTIVRNGSIIISDVSEIKTTDLNIEVLHENVVNNVNKVVTTVEQDSILPDIVYVNKPVYVMISPVVGNIDIFPAITTVRVKSNLSDDELKNITSLTLKIGTQTFNNVDGNILTFKIDSSAYYQSAEKYYLLTDDGNIVDYGVVNRE